MSSKRIAQFREAALIDTISTAVGFVVGVPIPTTVLTKMFRGSTQKFVDWEFSDWMTIYHNELLQSEMVDIPIGEKKYILPQTILCDFSEKGISPESVKIRLSEKRFKVAEKILGVSNAAFQSLKKTPTGKKLWNGPHVRLTNVAMGGDECWLEFEHVGYMDYARTNLVMDYRDKKYRQSLREVIHGDGQLCPLDRSLLANLVGINVLILTADGHMIVAERSKNVAFRPGEFCPAASGGLTEQDVKDKHTLSSVEKTVELVEEIGVHSHQVEIDEIKLLGITRELIRGGTPEMFFVGRSSLSGASILNDCWPEARENRHYRPEGEVEKVHVCPIGDKYAFGELRDYIEVHEFLLKMEECIDSWHGKASIPLLTAVALWIKNRIPSSLT